MKCCKSLSSLRRFFDPSRINCEALAAQADAWKGRAGELAARAGDLADYSAERARGFTLFDFSIYEFCLLSLGVWIGSRFARFFKRFRALVFLGFLASWVYLIWRVFLRRDDD